MKKFAKVGIIVGALACILAFGGCSGEVSTGDISVDVSAMAAELAALTYEDSLSELDTNIGLTYYGLTSNDVADSVIMVSTGATAEEVAVIEATDSDAAQTIYEACEARLSKQVTSYTDYKPAEVTRLDNAIIEVSGKYVVYVVTDDVDKAQDIVDSYFK